jgi:Flp pilus assembly protein TadD
VAVGHFGAETDRPIRRALLTRAENLVRSQTEDAAHADWLRGRIALLRSDGRQAVSYFTRALAMRPDETAWRYDLAIALKESGRYHEAQQHARVCLGMEPQNERYEALLREVTRARLAAKRST